MGEHHESATLPARLETSTAYQLTRAYRSAVRLAEQAFGAEVLRFSHYATLCWIEHLAPCSQRELADAMDSDPSDLVTVLRALEEEGLVRRGIDPDDRRRNLLELTRAGAFWLVERQQRADAYEAQLCRATGDGGAALRCQLSQLI